MMLDIQDWDYFNEVLALAAKVGMTENLKEKLDYLHNFRHPLETRCVLNKDFAPASFRFVMKLVDVEKEDGHIVRIQWKYWFNGGLIYHGPHDGFGSGAGPTFSVTLQPEEGWSIHT